MCTSQLPNWPGRTGVSHRGGTPTATKQSLSTETRTLTVSITTHHWWCWYPRGPMLQKVKIANAAADGMMMIAMVMPRIMMLVVTVMTKKLMTTSDGEGEAERRGERGRRCSKD